MTNTGAGLAGQITDGTSIVPFPSGALLTDGSAGKVSESGGVGDYLEFGTGDLTMDVMCRPGIAQDKCVFGLNNSIWLYVGSTGTASASTYINTLTSAAGLIKVGEWAHIAFTRSGNVHRLFINGVKVDEKTTSGTHPTATSVTVAGTPSSSFQGWVVWARAIKGKALWTADFVPPRRNVPPPRPGGCGAYYYFDLDAASNTMAYAGVGNSFQLYGTPGPRGRQLKFTSSQYSYAMVVNEPCVTFDTGSTGVLLWYDSTTFSLSSSDFTIDFWSWGSPYPLRKWGNSGERCWRIEMDSSNVSFYYTTDGITEVAVTRAAPVGPLASPKVWHHYAVVRTGNVIRIFQDGVQCGSDYSFSGTIYNSTTPSTCLGYTSSSTRQVMSYVRITIGSALWTGTSFTVPTKASYTVGTNTKALLPLDQDFGFMKAIYNPCDLVNKSRIWTNSGGVKTVYNNPFSPFDLGASDFTIECWVRHNYTGDVDVISQHDYENTLQNGWTVGLEASTYKLLFYYYYGTAVHSKAIPAYTWTHIAVSRVGSTLYLAVNGISESFSISSTIMRSLAPVAIGGPVYSSGSRRYKFLDGGVMGARITKGMALYGSAPFSPPAEALAKQDKVIWADDEECMDALECSKYSSTAYFYVMPNSDFNVGMGDFTVDAWVFSEWQGGLSRRTMILNRLTDGYMFYVSSSGALSFYTFVGGFSISVDGVVPTNKWTHVAFVRSGTGNGKLFVNGIEVEYANQQAFAGSQTSTNGVYVGGDNTTASSHGRLRFVRFSLGVLWTSNFTPPSRLKDYVVNDNTLLLLTGEKQVVGGNTNTRNAGRPGNTCILATNAVVTLAGAYASREMSLRGGNDDGSANYPVRLVELPEVFSSAGDTTRYLGLSRMFGRMGSPMGFYNSNEKIAIAQGYFNFNAFRMISVSKSGTYWYFGTSDFTIHMWFKYNGTAYPKHLINQGTDDNNFAFRLSIISSTQLKWSAKYSSTEEHAITASRGGVTINDGNWHHVAAVRSGTTTTIYLDGVSAGTETSSTEYRSYNEVLYLGDKGNYTAEVLINGGINSVEILRGRALWSASFTPPTDRRDFVHVESILSAHADLTGASTSQLYQNAIDISNARLSFSQQYYAGGGGSTGGIVKAFDFGSNNFTIDFWQRWCGSNPTGTWNVFVYSDYDESGSGAASASKMKIYWKYGGMFMFYFYITDGVTPYDVYGGSPAWNTWQHVALIRNGTSIKLYIDGTQVSSQTVAANYTIQNANGCYARPYSYGGGNVAFMEHFRIFQGKALWTADFTPPKRIDEYRRQFCRECTHWVHGNRSLSEGFMTEGSMAGGVYVQSLYDARPMTKVAMPWAPQGVDFTVEFWVKIYNRPGAPYYGRGIFGGGNPTQYGSYGGYDCQMNSSGVISFSIANEAGTSYAQTAATGPVDNGVWTHVAFVRKGTQVWSYTNGVPNGPGTHSTPMSYVHPTPTFMNDPSGNPWSFYGQIMDFQFHTGVAKYTHGFTPSPRRLKLPGKVMRF